MVRTEWGSYTSFREEFFTVHPRERSLSRDYELL